MIIKSFRAGSARNAGNKFYQNSTYVAAKNEALMQNRHKTIIAAAGENSMAKFCAKF